ncbi:phosphatases II [Hypoxylon fragiforme]|uniref:phosphatases II n=1 Tax=Hypoxylon fragiforme TaxID=63214 RepID=UPI0020C6C6E6|nr:phosphatases II [Hypoxylon fragiforme]KAI2607084.1 phosphatases II [Hypoxylon fragiforme]
MQAMATSVSPMTPRRSAKPAAPYSTRAPSPPPIIIPAPSLHGAHNRLKVVPNYEKVDPVSLSIDDIAIITQSHKEQLTNDSNTNWSYESRHVAQPILDYLYLGPFSVVRNREWLRETGITMLLAARDSQMASIRLMAVDKVAEELGIQATYVDVSNYNELIRAFPTSVRSINDHLLNVFRGQRISDVDVQIGDGQMVIPSNNLRRAKVLVFCETGNDRSAGVVVAYLMSAFGMDMIEACQFVHYKRFCVSLHDDLRQTLRSFEDILRAQRTVHRYELESSTSGVRRQKRSIDEAQDQNEEMGETNENTATDEDRFVGRTFVPFVDDNDNSLQNGL